MKKKNKQKKKGNVGAVIAFIILVIAVITISIEMKSYTPIDKDESKIVQQIDEKRLNDSAKFWYWQKHTKKKIVNQDILKRGIAKVIDLEKIYFDKDTMQTMCKETYCEASGNSIHGSLSGAKALKYDFDDDKIDEIIGYTYTYCKLTHCYLYILKNQSGSYKNIAWTGNIDNKYPIAVLNHKTNGFHDLVIFNFKDPDKPKLRRYGMDLTAGEYDDTIGVTKDEWAKYLKKAK